MYYFVLAAIAAVCFISGFLLAGPNSTASRIAQYERDLEEKEMEMDAARRIIESQRRTIGELKNKAADFEGRRGL